MEILIRKSKYIWLIIVVFFIVLLVIGKNVVVKKRQYPQKNLDRAGMVVSGEA